MHHLREVCAASSPPGDCLLARGDIRARGLIAATAVGAVLVSTRPEVGLGALGLSLLTLVASGARIRVLIGRFAGPLTFALLICLFQAFMTGRTPIHAVELGPWSFTATSEGLRRGILIASRIAGSFAVVMAFCHGALPEDLFAALRWARVPRIWIELAILMYRYIHVLLERAVSVIAAQKTRLGYGRVRQSLHSMGSLAGIVMLSSLDQAERSHEAMVARGYQGQFPLPTLSPLRPQQIVYACGGMSVVLTLYFLAERCLP